MEEQKSYEPVVEQAEEQPTNSAIFQESLPNSGLVLTLGILSIPFCCCFPISLPLGIIGWVMGNKGVSKYNQNPNAYTRSSYSNLSAGRVTAIVGVVLTVLYLTMAIYNIIQLGGLEAYMETVKEMAEQYQ